MKTSTVNISFQKKLLQEIDLVAEEEDRSRSEVIREAIRDYVMRKKRWKEIFRFGNQQAKKFRLKPKDIEKAVREARKSRA